MRKLAFINLTTIIALAAACGDVSKVMAPETASFHASEAHSDMAPVITSPAGSSVHAPGAVTFSWTAPTNPTHVIQQYQWSMSCTGVGCVSISETNETAATTSVNRILTPGEYTFAIRGRHTSTSPVHASQFVSVTFTIAEAQVTTYNLTAFKSGAGTGTVTSDPAGIDCGDDCSFSFDENTEVTLTAAAGLNSTFGGWSGACSGIGNCVITMDEAKSVTATFKANQSITFGAIDDVLFSVGGSLSVSATASSGLSVSFASQTPAVCTVSGTTVQFVLAGTCTIRASQAGNSDYNSAPDVYRSFEILAWTTEGFFQPVNMTSVNTVKGGATVPLKFEVFKGTEELSATSTIKEFKQVRYACQSGAPEETVDIVTTGGTSLRYDATAGQFIQNWQTPKQAGACYRATVTMQDGSPISAEFKLK